MTEILNDGTIGTYSLKNITGITKYNNNSIYISSKGTSKTLSSYILNAGNVISGSPNHSSILSGKYIRTITTYDNKIVATLKENFKVYLVNPILNTSTNLKVWNSSSETLEDLYDYALNPIIDTVTSCENICFKLISTIIIGVNMYLFIQSKCCHHRGNVLYVIMTQFDPIESRIVNNFTFETFFSLYKNGRLINLSRNVSKTITVCGVTYNTDDNVFVLLHAYGTNGKYGYITTLKKFDNFSGIGSKLNNTSLVIDHKPRGITYLGDGKYAVITNTSVGCGTGKQTKYYIIS